MYASLKLLLAAPLLLSACDPPQRNAQAISPPQQACRAPGNDPIIPATAAPRSTYLSTDAPPDRYRQGDVKLDVEFVSKEEANRRCAGGVPVCGRVFYACVQGGKLIAPNPCDYPLDQSFAKLMCHETAHRRGWPASHGD